MNAKLLPFKFYLKLYQLDGRVAGGVRYLKSIGCNSLKELQMKKKEEQEVLLDGQYLSTEVCAN